MRFPREYGNAQARGLFEKVKRAARERETKTPLMIKWPRQESESKRSNVKGCVCYHASRIATDVH